VKRKVFRLTWVVLFGLSCFVLGYTLKPKTDRRAMMQQMGFPSGGQSMPGRSAPPLRFPTR